MKVITIQVEDAAYEKFVGLVDLCPQVRLLDERSVADTEKERDECFKEAIMELRADRVIRKPRDYAWIMAALDQDLIEDFDGFYSAQSFINYLTMLGLEGLPNKTTLYRAYKLIEGDYPDWIFMDEPDDSEASRRKSVAVRLKSAFMRARRR